MKGSRKPAYRLVPPARDRSAGKQAIEILRTLDVELDPWQADVLMAGMGRDRAGHWVADEVTENVPRQNGKTLPLFGRVLWGVRNGESRIRWSAHEFKTAGESYFDLQVLCEHERMADLAPRFYVSNGKEAILFSNGARISFIARSKSSGRGTGSDLLVLDEAFALEDRHMAALKSTQAARKSPQIWYASSAPLEDSTVFRRLCIAGRAGTLPNAVYLEWSAPEDADPEDPHTWAAANPALGIRLTERFTRSELATLSTEDFARERLGIWREEDHVTILPGWADLTDATARPAKGAPRAIAVDIAPDRGHASIAAAGLLEDGRVLVQVLDSREGASWTLARVVELYRQHKTTVIVDDAGQSKTLIAPLEAKGVKVTRSNASDMVAACGEFYDRVDEGRLAHMGQADLTAAVEGAKQRDLGDGWAWSRRKSSTDITPLVASTLATFGVVAAKPARAEVCVA